jgi:tetratricopeptide (TPR) repeat protein
MNGDNEIAAQTLRDYLGQTPSAPGWLYEELAQALDENDPISARAVRERALQSDPRIVTSSLFLTSENAPLAGQILRLKALAQAHPQSPQTAWALSKIYLRAGQKDAALEAARRATSLAPGAPNQAALIEFLNSAGRRYEAGKTLDRALEKYPAAPLLWRLKAERALAQNDKSAAIAAWRKFYALDETQSGALHHVATLQEQLGAIQGALATRKAVRALRPQDAQAAKYLSAALRRNGDKNGAIATLREALQLDPTQVAWREELWILAGDKSVFDQVPGLIVREVAKPPSGADKNTRTHILLDEARQVVFADRATLTRYHQVIKIGDAAGAARYRKFALSLPVSARATLESLRIISNAKVRAVAANALQNNMLSLPALAIGDIVDLSYRVETAPPKEANPLTVQWYFGVAGTPVKTSRFVFITPVELPLMLRLHGEIPAPRVDDIRSGAAAWRVREWRLENVVADGALRLDIASAPAGHFAKP